MEDTLHKTGHDTQVWWGKVILVHILHHSTVSYMVNNSWVHKRVEDTVSNYYIELGEPQDKLVCHGFVKICNLVIDALKKKSVVSDWVFSSVPS